MGPGLYSILELFKLHDVRHIVLIIVDDHKCCFMLTYHPVLIYHWSKSICHKRDGIFLWFGKPASNSIKFNSMWPRSSDKQKLCVPQLSPYDLQPAVLIEMLLISKVCLGLICCYVILLISPLFIHFIWVPYEFYQWEYFMQHYFKKVWNIDISWIAHFLLEYFIHLHFKAWLIVPKFADYRKLITPLEPVKI